MKEKVLCVELPNGAKYRMVKVTEDGKIGILTLLVKTGIASSNRDARTLVTQNAISVNDEKFTDPRGLIDLAEAVIIKKGKKVFHKVFKA